MALSQFSENLVNCATLGLGRHCHCSSIPLGSEGNHDQRGIGTATLRETGRPSAHDENHSRAFRQQARFHRIGDDLHTDLDALR